MYWKRKYIQWTKCTKFLKYIKKWPNIRCKNMHICSSKVSNKYPILLQCNMNESNQKHNISEKAWEWDYTHFIFYKVLQKNTFEEEFSCDKQRLYLSNQDTIWRKILHINSVQRQMHFPAWHCCYPAYTVVMVICSECQDNFFHFSKLEPLSR